MSTFPPCGDGSARPQLVPRPRLVELAALRWSRRVVSIVAGPGFGKSVLLAEAVAQNRLAPRGVDLLVSCGESDASADVLLGRLCAAIGCGRDSADAAYLLAELGRRWPLGVAILLDDVHHLVGGDGEVALARLLVDAPASVHFVLAGRSRLGHLARLRAAGEVVDLGEADLALSGDEAAELARRHGADLATVDGVGGWPAMAALAAVYGVDAAHEYVNEELVDKLPPEDLAVLRVAAILGCADASLVSAALGGAGPDPAAVLGRMPMVRLDEGGELSLGAGAPRPHRCPARWCSLGHPPSLREDEFVVHDLWRRVLCGSFDDADDDRAAVVERGVAALSARGAFDRAFQLGARERRWDLAADVVRGACGSGHPQVGPAVLSAWWERWPRDRHDEPAGLLLEGLVTRIADPFSPATVAVLDRAAAACAAAGDVVGEVTANNELAYVLRNRGCCERLPALFGRAVELHSEGHAVAAGPAALASALLAEAAGDERRAVAELDAIGATALSPGWRAVAAFRLAMVRLTLGDEREMLAAAQRCRQLAGDTTARHALALARWYAGEPDDALASCAEIAADAERSAVDAVALGAFATMVLASAGRVEEAAAQLALAEAEATGPLSPLMDGYLIGVRALVAAASGDDPGASAVIDAALQKRPLTSAAGWTSATRWLPLAYVLVPDARAEIGERAEGLHARRLAVAGAVVAAREGGCASALDVALDPDLVATTVPLPWAMALACGLAPDRGMELAERLLARFGEPARAALRGVATTPCQPRLAAGARRLLAALSLAPTQPVRLAVLGPTELDLGTYVALDSAWQRDRVRSLLLYLVLHGPARREQIVDALWPDLAPDAADRNLRVTLSHLQRVLEPTRQRGEAPFLLRQTGSTLALAGPPHLEVDITAFEVLVDQGHDADGRGLPGPALERFEEAMARWRGACLADAAYESWAQSCIRHLTERFVGAALRAAELQLAAGRPVWARANSRRALAADPWSERAHRILVAAALAEDDRATAGVALRECDAMLAELGVAPGPETEMLRRRTHDTTGG